MIKQDRYWRLYTTSERFAQNFRAVSDKNPSFIKNERAKRKREEEWKYIPFYYCDDKTWRYYLPGSVYDLPRVSMGSYNPEYAPGKKMDDYQIKAIESVKEFTTKWMLLRSWEGTGKSAMTRAIAEWLYNAWHKIVVITSVKDIQMDLEKEIPFAEVMCMPTFTNRYEELNDGRFLIFDEGHHTSQKKIKELCLWKWRFILSTASPDRSNEYGRDWFETICWYVHETNTEALPIKVVREVMENNFTVEQASQILEWLADDSPLRWQKLLAANQERNDRIVDIAWKALASQKKVLVATRFVDHAKNLYDKLSKIHDNVLLYTWSTNKKKVKEFIKDNDSFILVCSIWVIKEWFNVKDLMVGILACDIASYTPYRQFAWRMRRRYPGKKFWYVFDFKDKITFYSDWNKIKTKYMNFNRRKKYWKELSFTFREIKNA